MEACLPHTQKVGGSSPSPAITWVGRIVAIPADCKSATLETPLVQLHLCPLLTARMTVSTT